MVKAIWIFTAQIMHVNMAVPTAAMSAVCPSERKADWLEKIEMERKYSTREEYRPLPIHPRMRYQSKNRFFGPCWYRAGNCVPKINEHALLKFVKGFRTKNLSLSSFNIILAAQNSNDYTFIILTLQHFFTAPL
jgi:hypothetical protein